MELKPLKYFDSLYPSNTREKELRLLIPFIEKGLSTQLVGLPGSGKSNILRLLAYNREARHANYGDYEKYLHFVYLDCSEVKGKSLFDITKFILISLSFSLGERRMTEESQRVNQFLSEGLKTQDEIFLFQGLKKSVDYLSVEKKLTISLLFDRFESIIPSLDTQFFSNLRTLRDRAKYRFECVFSLNRPLEDLIDPVLTKDFHELIADNRIYSSLKDGAWLTFRASYIEKAARQSLPEGVFDEVISLTGGHARLSKLSFESLVTEEKQDDLKNFLLKKPTIQNALKEIWINLTPQEQMALKDKMSFDTIKSTLPYLTDSSLVDENGITIPLFEDYISCVPVESGEKLSYNTTTKEILMGETSLSDKLSPSEFKLLRYLIENEGKICTKDEIITSIWGDQKSYEGVTDQALDQIFYRVRKKVEKDPSNPKYIQTIKGLGYKLA